MSTKIIGTCSLCQGPVAIIEPWMGTHSCVPTCQNCGARKKDPYGPVIEMVPYKGLPGTILPIDPSKITDPIDWKLGSPTCGSLGDTLLLAKSILAT